MQLTVVTKSLGAKLNEMLIYAGSTQIGEYERSQDADIERKKLEIENVADLLLWVHSKHGRFTVRWDGDTRHKSVRVADVEVCIIPKIAWGTPSWQS
jgi:hypothetical protein